MCGGVSVFLDACSDGQQTRGALQWGCVSVTQVCVVRGSRLQGDAVGACQCCPCVCNEGQQVARGVTR